MPRTGPRTYLRRTNKPNTCLWCGRNIRTKGYPYRGYAWTHDRDGWEGYNFCSLVCTERFAVAMLNNGARLKPYEGEPD